MPGPAGLPSLEFAPLWELIEFYFRIVSQFLASIQVDALSLRISLRGRRFSRFSDRLGQSHDDGPFPDGKLLLWQEFIVPDIPNGLCFIGFYFIISTVSWRSTRDDLRRSTASSDRSSKPRLTASKGLNRSSAPNAAAR